MMKLLFTVLFAVGLAGLLFSLVLFVALFFHRRRETWRKRILERLNQPGSDPQLTVREVLNSIDVPSPILAEKSPEVAIVTINDALTRIKGLKKLTRVSPMLDAIIDHLEIIINLLRQHISDGSDRITRHRIAEANILVRSAIDVGSRIDIANRKVRN